MRYFFELVYRVFAVVYSNSCAKAMVRVCLFILEVSVKRYVCCLWLVYMWCASVVMV